MTPRKERSGRGSNVFSSPPLAPLGSGRAFQGEEESEFLLDSGPPLPPEKGRFKNREGLPPSGSGHARSGAGGGGAGGGGGGGALRTLNAADRPLSMGVAGMALVEAEAGKREGVVAVAPPAFHDLVKRSTRFMTSGERAKKERVCFLFLLLGYSGREGGGVGRGRLYFWGGVSNGHGHHLYILYIYVHVLRNSVLIAWLADF